MILCIGLSPAELATAHATRAEVVVISGSMPSGAPDDAVSDAHSTVVMLVDAVDVLR